MDRYEFNFPYSRTMTVNTLCVVGVCTCVILKMAVEKVFRSLGIEEFDVEPATEDNPLGPRTQAPDVILCESLRIDDVRARVPSAVVVEVRDVADHEQLREDIVEQFTKAGWLIKN